MYGSGDSFSATLVTRPTWPLVLCAPSLARSELIVPPAAAETSSARQAARPSGRPACRHLLRQPGALLRQALEDPARHLRPLDVGGLRACHAVERPRALGLGRIR